MPAGAASPITRARLRAAARALAGVAHTTPVLSSHTFSRMAGCRVGLNAAAARRPTHVVRDRAR